jgi:hypothetical protein
MPTERGSCTTSSNLTRIGPTWSCCSTALPQQSAGPRELDRLPPTHVTDRLRNDSRRYVAGESGGSIARKVGIGRSTVIKLVRAPPPALLLYCDLLEEAQVSGRV